MKKLLSLFAALLPLSTFAHEGHSNIDYRTLGHYFGTAEHAVPVIVLSIIAVWLGLQIRKSMRQIE